MHEAHEHLCIYLSRKQLFCPFKTDFSCFHLSTHLDLRRELENEGIIKIKTRVMNSLNETLCKNTFKYSKSRCFLIAFYRTSKEFIQAFKIFMSNCYTQKIIERFNPNPSVSKEYFYQEDHAVVLVLLYSINLNISTNEIKHQPELLHEGHLRP